MAEPPLGAVYQLIVFPDDVAFNFRFDPLHILTGFEGVTAFGGGTVAQGMLSLLKG